MTTIQVGTYRTHNDGRGFREVKKKYCPTIPARAREDGSGMPVIRQLPRGKNKGADLKICPTISSNAFQENNLLDGVRRLTEIECERLQGFPDNWTQYGYYEGVIKPIAKTQRYKLIGNAVTVDIVELIAKRLKFLEQ
nr:MAG TPA: Cytosine specific methyltransferase [Caudoviricetes sp.]